MSADERRAAAIAGFRKLADLLEEHPELPLPWHGFDGGALTIYMLHADRAAFVAAARALPGRANKVVDGDVYRVKTMLDALEVEVVAYRETVCERVVTGTREVTKTVPDPNITVPVIEVTETVEDVEWVCGPLLAGELS